MSPSNPAGIEADETVLSGCVIASEAAGASFADAELAA
jgi:hypothetical protein